MKRQFKVLLLALFPIALYAQESDKRRDVIILPQELNDQYQSLKNYLAGTDGQVRKLQQTREEIKKHFPDTRDAQDLEAMLNGLDQQEQRLENERKDWKAKMDPVEAKIKEIILNAHGRTVEWRTYNANPVDKLGTVITTTYKLQNDQIIAVDDYYQLPEPAQH